MAGDLGAEVQGGCSGRERRLGRFVLGRDFLIWAPLLRGCGASTPQFRKFAASSVYQNSRNVSGRRRSIFSWVLVVILICVNRRSTPTAVSGNT